MIKLGIIGAGTIFRSYVAALSALPQLYQTVAVCDTDPEKLREVPALAERFGLCGQLRLFLSVAELLSCEAESVVISTPPETHFSLAMQCLKRGKNVLLEKPAVLSCGELDALYETAQSTGALLHVAYHAAFAADLAWYAENRDVLSDRYGLTGLSGIVCGFYDPYVAGGALLAGKERLMGSYLDSGVNELSVCQRLTDLSGFSTACHQKCTDRNGTTVASNTRLTNQKITLELDTGWIYNLNRKGTFLQFKKADRQLFLDHSGQRVLLQRTMPADRLLPALRGERPEALAEGLCLFGSAGTDRLTRQYIGVFSDFSDSVLQRTANSAATRCITRLLLENYAP